MAKYFGAGIPLSASFDLSGQKPLDARSVAADITERDAIPEIQKYEGMTVYVESTKLTYQLIDGEWITFGTNSDSVIANLHSVATSGDYRDLENKPATEYVAQAEEPEDLLVQIWVDTTVVAVEEEAGE